jgi:hypothetical protein
MSSQRYERVRIPSAKPRHAIRPADPHEYMANNHLQVSPNDEESPITPQTPTSPPPSFRSRASSPTSRHHDIPVDQNLADTFGADGSESDEENDGDDRQRLMRGTPPSSTSTEQVNTETTTTADTPRPPIIERRVTHLPVFAPRTTGRVYGGGSGSDGVFANLSAKPETGEKAEEHPPVRL